MPRGLGLNKRSTAKHMKAVKADLRTLTSYARRNSFHVDSLVMAFEKYCPEDWEEYRKTRFNFPRRSCEYCGGSFLPSSAKRRFCTKKCWSESRVDARYFGGRRRMTVGLKDGICQLCGNRPLRGLSSHHVFGKENDPGNLHLVALCRGCHKLVTILASRMFVGDEVSWESLITLAWLRKHGRKVVSTGAAIIEVCVEIDSHKADEDEMEESWAAPPGAAIVVRKEGDP